MGHEPLDVTLYVCPVCLTVGTKDGRCPHYESGSVGWVHYTRRPATLAVMPQEWTPVLDSLASDQIHRGTEEIDG